MLKSEMREFNNRAINSTTVAFDDLKAKMEMRLKKLEENIFKAIGQRPTDSSISNEQADTQEILKKQKRYAACVEWQTKRRLAKSAQDRGACPRKTGTGSPISRHD